MIPSIATSGRELHPLLTLLIFSLMAYFLYNSILERFRLRKIREFAARNGFFYGVRYIFYSPWELWNPDENFSGLSEFGESLKELNLFKKNRYSKIAYDIFYKKYPNYSCSIFNYGHTPHFATGKRKHKTHNLIQTLVCIHCPEFSWPHLEIHPKNVFQKAREFFSPKTKTPRTSGFLAGYRVNGEGKSVISQFVQRSLIRELERLQGWSLEVKGHNLVFYNSRNWIVPYKMISPSAYPKVLEQTERVFASLTRPPR